jgi:hypothetical protein
MVVAASFSVSLVNTIWKLFVGLIVQEQHLQLPLLLYPDSSVPKIDVITLKAINNLDIFFHTVCIYNCLIDSIIQSIKCRDIIISNLYSNVNTVLTTNCYRYHHSSFTVTI